MVLVFTAIIAVAILLYMYIQPFNRINNTIDRDTEATTSQKYSRKALIYDSLAREYPNRRAIEYIIKLLVEAGYRVDYYCGGNATLDPLYNLGEYELVIIRAHGGFNYNPRIGWPIGEYIYTGIYYSEAVKLYGKDYMENLYRGYYVTVGVIPRPGYTIDQLPKYVVVSPLFFKDFIDSMKRDSIIIYTGCWGLDTDTLARIFLEKGAYAYVSFKGNVTWVFSDQVLEALVEKIASGEDIVEAYDSLDNKYKIDPLTGALLSIKCSG